MNKEKILQLADAIEQGLKDVKFDMMYFGEKNRCGTFGCIAGHAVALFNPETWQSRLEGYIIGRGIFEGARDLLELTHHEATELFLPDDFYRLDLGKITKEIAVKTLRDFAETGKIEWPESVREED